MDRIKRLSMQVLKEYREKFGTDFTENKKILDSLSIVRSKSLKNELAGYITKIIKREIRYEEEKKKQEQSQAENMEQSPEAESESIRAEPIESMSAS